MIKAKIICNWAVLPEFYFDVPVELYIDQYPKTPKPKGLVRFCLSHEPHPLVAARAFFHPEYYDYLLTWKTEHLLDIPHARFFHAFDNRCGDYVPRVKEFAVSTVVGEKNEFVGHHMRQMLYLRQNEITIPKKFYLSGNKKWADIKYTDQPLLDFNTKDALWNTQFHIAIENLFPDNWFTEKLIDCFLTDTVPVYIGPPNIENYFNMDGIILCKNIEEIIEKCNALTPETYDTMKVAMQDNKERTPYWTSMPAKIEREITAILQDRAEL